MDRAEVVALLVHGIKELQTESGLQEPDVVETTRPLDLEDFDSLKCLEFEVLLSAELGVEIKELFVPEAGSDRDLSVGDLADRVLAKTAQGADNHV